MASLVHRLDTKQIKLVLRLPPLFGFRMWLTIKLLLLAGMVSPTTIEISHGHD